MQEPTPRSSRLLIAASLAAVIALGGGGFLLGRGTVQPAPPPVAAASFATVPAAATPRVDVLDRASLIALGNAAADAAASGAPVAADRADAIGKRFDLLLPFGCNGPATPDSNVPLRWTYDEENSALRIHVEPATWQPGVVWGDRPPAEADSLVGFWIAQPWSSQAACPPTASVTAAPGMEPVTLPGQTLGVAQILTAGAPRRSLGQGQPYTAVVRVDRADLDVSRGLRLRVTGRIGKFPNGAPTRCIQPAGSEQRPICIVAVVLNELAVINPVATAPIATWSVGQDVRSDS